MLWQKCRRCYGKNVEDVMAKISLEKSIAKV
jgi:hypothetical protein